MRKIIYLIIGLVVVVGILVQMGNLAGNGVNKDENNSGTSDEFGGYFMDQMIVKGVADIGMPIEGFDANLLIRAYGGLKSSDFASVEAFEGHYEVQGNEVVFVRDQASPISSAEKTISNEGFATLLKNVSSRLNIKISSNDDIDVLIETINTNEGIAVRIGETGEALGIRITPLEMLEDSRCPSDVQCIQAGTVRVRVKLESGLGIATQEFELNKVITTEVENITLTRVEPQTIAGKKVLDGEYVFYFEISKRAFEHESN